MGDSPNGMGTSLAKLQNKSAMSHHHRQLLDACRRSSRIGSMLSLPRSITDRSDELFKRVLESKAVRYKDAETLMAACIFMICKAERVPRTLKGKWRRWDLLFPPPAHVLTCSFSSWICYIYIEMCGVCDVTRKDLGKCFNRMKNEGFHKTVLGGAGGGRHSVSADEERHDEMASYLARWGNYLRMPLPLIELAKIIAANTQHVLLKGSEPSSVCGAALYVAGYCGVLHDRRTYEVIEQACHINASTLRGIVQNICRRDPVENSPWSRIMPPQYQQTIILT
jgi:transcription initiation factor TFIIIB Brf1 subunit/transcription initiation factor TFIIB